MFAGCDSAFTPRDSREFVRPPGCGKTTLLRCITRMQRLTSGACWVDGEIWPDETMFRPHSSASHRGCISAADFFSFLYRSVLSCRARQNRRRH
ncbi:ATP-binding cassette domain-containing protein [Bradyrhizobium sp. CCBAU 11357]|uniref:ATP-binding cassette domain-containing protein n=1 Tax=Bradyrhizobium sp. CCBAU 11357 TaxID=1630808 RepID=UPI003FA43E69